MWTPERGGLMIKNPSFGEIYSREFSKKRLDINKKNYNVPKNEFPKLIIWGRGRRAVFLLARYIDSSVRNPFKIKMYHGLTHPDR